MEELAPALVLMPILAVIMTMIIVSGVKKIREREIRHRERIRAMELGVELPPEADTPPVKRNGSRKDALGLQGTIWTGVGAGFLVGRFLFARSWAADSDLAEMTGFLTLLALPALFVGLGLVIYAMTLPRENGKD